MTDAALGRSPLAQVEVPLERDSFLRTLLRHLTGTLQDVIGTEEASGFISVVGQEMGEQIGDLYRSALAVDNLNAEQVAEVMVDLKRRIRGDFYVIEQDEEKIVLGNRACPFAEEVVGRQGRHRAGHRPGRSGLPGRRLPQADAGGRCRTGPRVLQGIGVRP